MTIDLFVSSSRRRQNPGTAHEPGRGWQSHPSNPVAQKWPYLNTMVTRLLLWSEQLIILPGRSTWRKDGWPVFWIPAQMYVSNRVCVNEVQAAHGVIGYLSTAVARPVTRYEPKEPSSIPQRGLFSQCLLWNPNHQIIGGRNQQHYCRRVREQGERLCRISPGRTISACQYRPHFHAASIIVELDPEEISEELNQDRRLAEKCFGGMRYENIDRCRIFVRPQGK